LLYISKLVISVILKLKQKSPGKNWCFSTTTHKMTKNFDLCITTSSEDKNTAKYDASLIDIEPISNYRRRITSGQVRYLWIRLQTGRACRRRCFWVCFMLSSPCNSIVFVHFINNFVVAKCSIRSRCCGPMSGAPGWTTATLCNRLIFNYDACGLNMQSRCRYHFITCSSRSVLSIYRVCIFRACAVHLRK